jgi:hypothetical protein
MAKCSYEVQVMPKVAITNNTKVKGSALPNGVKLAITVGTANPVNLEVGQTGNYVVDRSQVIRIKPENTSMQGVNYQQPDGNDRKLSIIPADADNYFGVKIA